MASTASPSLKRHQDDNAGGPPKKAKNGPDQDKIKKMMAEARAKAAAVAAKLAANKIGAAPNHSPTPPPPSSASPTPSAVESPAERIARLKSRVASAVSRAGAASSHTPPNRTPFHRRDENDMDEVNKARGGLDVGLHPALLGDSGDSGSGRRGRNAVNPKFATTMANRRGESFGSSGRGQKQNKKQLDISGPSPDLTDPSKNPYFDPNISSKPINTRRIPKALVFNQKGKYIEQANMMRRQEALEAMKRRIAAAASRAGIAEDMHADKAFAPEQPPDIEWWDQNLTANATYDDLDTENMRIHTEDSIITHYIQHPIQLEPPQDKHIPAPKPLPLTKKEQKKVRRQNRAEVLKEKQAKIRLGLEPPPPPKVKKSNMMRVLGEEAVKDPTAVEARVNREIRERMEAHLQTNEERKLSKEERHQKLQENQQKDMAKGIYCIVFRVETLASGKHRFKINKNADQMALAGICIMNPKFNLIVVEGGQKSISMYKKLMLNRIDWTEKAEPIEGSVPPEDPQEANVDMTKNRCTLVWEGEVKQRGFKKFTTERCPTDAMAKERLERAKMENMWTLAKNLAPTED